jgi:transketolase
MHVAEELEKLSKPARVVSLPCWQLFEQQSAEYKQSVLGGQPGKRVSIEAAGDMGWHKYIGNDGIAIAIDGYGASAPASVLAKEYGFTVDAILERIL